jgi:hypothetical protein
MKNPPQIQLTPVDTARLSLVQALCTAKDGARARPLAETVQSNLDHLWERGGREGNMLPGLRPDWITVRRQFLIRPSEDRRALYFPSSSSPTASN